MSLLLLKFFPRHLLSFIPFETLFISFHLLWFFVVLFWVYVVLHYIPWVFFDNDVPKWGWTAQRFSKSCKIINCFLMWSRLYAPAKDSCGVFSSTFGCSNNDDNHRAPVFCIFLKHSSLLTVNSRNSSKNLGNFSWAFSTFCITLVHFCSSCTRESRWYFPASLSESGVAALYVIMCSTFSVLWDSRDTPVRPVWANP